MIDLDDLRKRAEAATPGPWTAHPGAEAYSVTTPSAPLTWDDHGGEVFTRPNAAHIAAADPSTVLALIDRCEAAEAAVARARKVLEGYVAEYDDPVYHGNGFTDGVTAASKHALSALDGEDA